MTFYLGLTFVAIIAIAGSMQMPVGFVPIFLYGLYKIYIENDGE